MTLHDVAAKGERLGTLRAFRDELARSIGVCDSGRDKASLGRLFVDVLAQIDELGGGTVAKPRETGLSDFEKRLRARESRTKAPRRSQSS